MSNALNDEINSLLDLIANLFIPNRFNGNGNVILVPEYVVPATAPKIKYEKFELELDDNVVGNCKERDVANVNVKSELIVAVIDNIPTDR